jgi:stage II sporulation protein AB (anti-sigma F factor)
MKRGVKDMKKARNLFKLVFPSRSSNEAFARTAVASFVAQLDPTLDELSDIKTAVSEAVTNCIVHAYKDNIGLIYITARIFDDGRIDIVIKDRGCGIRDIRKAMQPTYTSGGGERAGLGFSVMEAFMDTLTVRSRVFAGTSVYMSKQIKLK